MKNTMQIENAAKQIYHTWSAVRHRSGSDGLDLSEWLSH